MRHGYLHYFEFFDACDSKTVAYVPSELGVFLHLVIAYFSVSLMRLKPPSGKTIQNDQQKVEQLLVLLHCGSNILKLLVQCFASENVLFCLSGEI